AGPLVGYREREHATEPVQGPGSPVPPGLEHDLGVRFGDEADSPDDELGPHPPVVVQLAVVDDGQAVLGQRLVGRGGQIADRQPPLAKLYRHAVVLVVPGPGRVRPAVGDPVGHDVHELLAAGLLVTPCDTAHFSPWPVPGSWWQRAEASRTPSGRRVPGGSRQAPARPAHARASPARRAWARRP